MSESLRKKKKKVFVLSQLQPWPFWHRREKFPLVRSTFQAWRWTSHISPQTQYSIPRHSTPALWYPGDRWLYSRTDSLPRQNVKHKRKVFLEFQISVSFRLFVATAPENPARQRGGEVTLKEARLGMSKVLACVSGKKEEFCHGATVNVGSLGAQWRKQLERLQLHHKPPVDGTTLQCDKCKKAPQPRHAKLEPRKTYS